MPAGRPRAFDPDEALDRALRVFWRQGYEGTTLLELTRAMGINRPSLYAAFGNKEELFRKALDRYARGPAAYLADALQEPTARAAAERLLGAACALLTDPRYPPGCMAVTGALACGEASDSIRRELAARRACVQESLRVRFARAVEEGDLPATTDPGDLARYLATVVNGMSVQAAGGATRDELRRVVETALRAWPV